MKKKSQQLDVVGESSALLPAWIVGMRKAAQEVITEKDIKEIVKSQVKRAKEGDKGAIKFVFEQVLGGSHMKGATFIQNNYRDDPNKATKVLPGSPGKIEVMKQRVSSGHSACVQADAQRDDS